MVDIDRAQAWAAFGADPIGAEQHANGKASKAEYERTNKRGQWVYDVEVVAGAKVFDTKVDPTSGAVLSSTQDKVDNDDEHDEKD